MTCATQAPATTVAAPERRRRTALVGLRLLPEENEAVQALAEAWGCTATEVVRRALLRELYRA